MDFNPRSPCGERQSPQTVREGVITYFNPRSPCGERLAAVMIDGEATLFQSTLSLRRATIPPGLHHFPNRNFNPRSPCGERPGPLTGPAPLRYFNPRSPCGERPSWQLPFEPSYPFQSTLSLRRATSGSGSNWSRVAYFNPRSPCGERHPTHQERGCGRYFNPRSPCGERPGPMVRLNSTITFQSTLSLRRATGHPIACHTLNDQISIHALLAESDHGHYAAYPQDPRFQSTLSLRRATREGCGCIHTHIHFNPRSPCGERPCIGTISITQFCISIHALLAESDSHRGQQGQHPGQFQSTLSLRRATAGSFSIIGPEFGFQSTLSLRRATLSIIYIPWRITLFQSTLSLRRATAGSVACFRPTGFQSTLSLRRATQFVQLSG